MLVILIFLLLKNSANYLSSALLGSDPINISQSLLFLIAYLKSRSSTYSSSWGISLSSSSSMLIESTVKTSYPFTEYFDPFLHSYIKFYISGLNYSGTSKTAVVLLCLLIPFTASANYYEIFFLRKLNINPGAWYYIGHLTMYVIYPYIEHKMDLCDIFFVCPEMKAKALAKEFTAPY